MKRFLVLLVACLLSIAFLRPNGIDSAAVSLRYGAHKHFKPTAIVAQSRSQAIKTAFRAAWYHHNKQKSVISDLLMPLGEYPDAWSAWDGTSIDALSTAILMGFSDITETITSYAVSINFRSTPVESSLLASTRTFIGGLLSAYDLLAGPFSHLVNYDEDLLADLLSQLQVLADSHLFAFNTPSHLPDNILLLGAEAEALPSQFTSIEMSGALELEWTRLSHLLGNESYSLSARTAGRAVAAARTTNCHEPFPGLFARSLNIKTGRFVSYSGGFNNEASQYYDNLLKMFLYSPTDSELDRDRWVKAMNSAIKHLITHPRPDLSLFASFDCTNLQYTADLSSFSIAGSLILGGSSLGMHGYVQHGLSLLETQIKMYQSTTTGLAPEAISWDLSKGEETSQQSYKQEQFAAQNGFSITDAKNELKGEIFENLYYAYRVTGEERYRNLSWEIYTALSQSALFEDGLFKGIDNVNAKLHGDITGRRLADWGQLMAKTFKFAYLIHLDEEPWCRQRNCDNMWLFNSRGHLLHTRDGQSNEVILSQHGDGRRQSCQHLSLTVAINQDDAWHGASADGFNMIQRTKHMKC